MVKLEKGQKVNLTKEAPGLQKIRIGLGWKAHGGLLKAVLSNYDLDASCIICRHGRFVNLGDIVYFGQLCDRSEAIRHCGDNLVGSRGVKDDEQILVDLNKLPSDVDRLGFVVNIFEASDRKQKFADIKHAYIRICNAETDEEILRYDLVNEYPKAIGMAFGEVYKEGNAWQFRAIGEEVDGTSISAMANYFR